MRSFEGLTFKLKRSQISPHVLSGSVGKMYSKPIFDHSYALIIILIHLNSMCDLVWDAVKDVWMEIRPTLHYYYNILFYDHVFMTCLWMVLLFIAKQVAVCVAFVLRKSGALSKSLSGDIFGLGGGRKFQIGKMCSISGAMTKCIGVFVYLCMSLNINLKVVHI